MVVGIAVAAYIVLPQLAQVDFANVIATAEWSWALGAVVCSVLTFAGASIALNGAVRIHLNFVRTYMTQLAIAFTGLVAPAAVGNIALNTRYLQTSGLPPAVAGAGVGVAQVAQFCSYFILLLVAGVLAGTGPRASFTPPAILFVVVPIAVILLLGLLAVPRVRGLLTTRIIPPIKAAIPQVLAVFQTPAKLAQLIGGALLLDASFVAALVCATRAFGAETSIPATAVVYFAGAIIGSAVPTPGGLGGIEGRDVRGAHRDRRRQWDGGLVGAAVPARDVLAADPVRVVLAQPAAEDPRPVAAVSGGRSRSRTARYASALGRRGRRRGRGPGEGDGAHYRRLSGRQQPVVVRRDGGRP